VRVTAQLIDASSGHQIWADRYDRSRGDFLGLQDEITREVVSALQVQLTDGEQARVWARGTRDLKAWENIVRATEKYHSHHRDEIPKARDLALEATRIDPEFAAAWAVLGWTYWVEARWDWSERRDESLGTAYELAHRSLRMDSHLPDGLTLLAVTELHLGRHDEALATFERACLSAPNHSYVAALGAAIGSTAMWRRLSRSFRSRPGATRMWPFLTPTSQRSLAKPAAWRRPNRWRRSCWRSSRSSPPGRGAPTIHSAMMPGASSK
jgi:tetratricopeptide (TPR) repeat protein